MEKKYTEIQINRAAIRAAKAFHIWNTSNQGATPRETLSLQVKKDQAFIQLLHKLEVNPNDFMSWKESQ